MFLFCPMDGLAGFVYMSQADEAGMVHSVSGCTRGVQVNSEIP